MKKLLIISFIASLKTMIAQDNRDFITMGVQGVSGQLGKISELRDKDSYLLYNYPTMVGDFWGMDGYYRFDISGAMYFPFNFASANSSEEGYNVLTRTDRFMNRIENRILFEYQHIKYKEEGKKWHRGHQFGLRRFGWTDHRYNATEGTFYAETPDTGPFFVRTNIYGGLTWMNNRPIGEHLLLTTQIQANLSLARVNIGAMLIPSMRLRITFGKIALTGSVAYEAFYSYSPTQNIYKDFTLASQSAYAGAIRYDVGLGFNFRNK